MVNKIFRVSEDKARRKKYLEEAWLWTQLRILFPLRLQDIGWHGYVIVCIIRNRKSKDFLI